MPLTESSWSFSSWIREEQCGGTSLVAQWLRLHALNARGPAWIPGQGTRPYMPQIRPGTAKWKINKKKWTVYIKKEECSGSTHRIITALAPSRTSLLSFQDSWTYREPFNSSACKLFPVYNVLRSKTPHDKRNLTGLSTPAIYVQDIRFSPWIEFSNQQRAEGITSLATERGVLSGPQFLDLHSDFLLCF